MLGESRPRPFARVFVPRDRRDLIAPEQSRASRHRLLRIKRRSNFQQRIKGANAAPAEVPDRQCHGVAHAARWVAKGAVDLAGLGRQFGASPTDNRVDRLFADVIGQVVAKFRPVLGPRRFGIALVSLLDDRPVNRRVHLRRAGLPDQDARVVPAVVLSKRAVELAPLRVGAGCDQQHASGDIGQPRPERAHDFHVGVGAGLVRAPERNFVSQHRGEGIAARGAEGRRGDLDDDPVVQDDRFGGFVSDLGPHERHRLEQAARRSGKSTAPASDWPR